MNTYAENGFIIGGATGNITGLIYAFRVKSGFLKGIGFFVLGGIVGSTLGFGIGSLVKKKEEDKINLN